MDLQTRRKERDPNGANDVEYVDANIVQYTTRTQLGAPVFNDAFNAVVIHQAGGSLREPSTARRNQPGGRIRQ
ncbi:MAG: hypothetical protein ACREVH_02900 [Gammaproteobacteria bacterium]